MTHRTPQWHVIRDARPTSEDIACWPWHHYINDKGYGYVKVEGRRTGAHRLSYRLHVGTIPPGLVIDHVCQNRACWNPNHLRAVTNKANMEYRSGLDASNTSGWRGASFHKSSGKWQARVVHHGREVWAGAYRCPTAAGLAALAKRRELGFLES